MVFAGECQQFDDILTWRSIVQLNPHETVNQSGAMNPHYEEES